ncbi:MAG: hypothetical protein NTX27_04135 [Verrucomicrobia bacterium]|nr:hypothetical protein [Verrucomicrobiota bacterium]
MLNASAIWKSLSFLCRLIPVPGNACGRLGVALIGAGLLTSAQAQPQLTGKLKGFTVSPEFYTNSSQMKSLLKGAEAEPLPGGLVRLSGVRLQRFHPDGTPELLVTAPECLFDNKTRIASSTGRLEASSADGRFVMSGLGFASEQTPPRLFISNRVQTVILVPTVESNPLTTGMTPSPALRGTNLTSLAVESDQFVYSGETGMGIYTGNVRVAGTNLNLESDTLTIKVPMQERKFQTVAARSRVHINYAGVQATGDTADYDSTTGLLRVGGNPAWEMQGRKGRADELLIDRTNRTFTAQGNSWLRLPGQSLGDFNLQQNSTNQPAPKSGTNQFIEIRSPTCTFHTNFAVFGEPVRVEQFEDEHSQSVLTCQHLTVRSTGTNELQSILAERDIRIEQGANRFMAGTALFTATNRMLWLTNQPRWESGPRNGTADLLLLDGVDRALVARGNATMSLPASELAQTSFALGPSRTNTPSTLTDTTARVTCSEYRLSPESAYFRENVRLDHPQMAWECQRLLVQIPPTGGRVERLVAEEKVSFNFLDSHGQKLSGRGEKAVYNYTVTPTATNDLMELTGNPILQTTNGTFQNPIFLLNLGTGKLVAPGTFKMHGEIPGADTNMFRFPSLK